MCRGACWLLGTEGVPTLAVPRTVPGERSTGVWLSCVLQRPSDVTTAPGISWSSFLVGGDLARQAIAPRASRRAIGELDPERREVRTMDDPNHRIAIGYDEPRQSGLLRILV